jgi:hypothetical protein
LEVTGQDSREAARVVGFLEYGQALQHFDALVKKATTEELDTFEEIVRERDELTVYTNLSRRLRHPPSSLDERSETESEGFQRRGLAWIMALARVELGAILAAFTYVPRPFEAVAATAYDVEPYQEMLQDGLRSHYWALCGDSSLPRVAQRFLPTQESLAYLRRFVVAQAFLRAAYRAAERHYSAVQRAELNRWKQTLDTFQLKLVSNFRKFLAEQTLRRARKSYLTDCETACKKLAVRAGQ